MVQVAVDTSYIVKHFSNAKIFTGVTAPADGAVLALTGGAPASGVDIGATQGEATFMYQSKIETVDIEQAYGGVAPHAVSEEVHIRCTMLEHTYANMLRALSQGTGSTSGGVNKIELGGKTAVTGFCVAMVAKHDTEALYDVAVIYDAVQMAPVSFDVKRGQERKIQLDLTGRAVPARAVGDQIAQWLEGVASA